MDEYTAFNHTTIIGIDEAGRGCLAGPLVVGAAMFPWNGPNRDEYDIELINTYIRDSKQVSPLRRAQLFPVIKDITAHYWAYVSNIYIDHNGMLAAAMKGLTECLELIGQDNLDAAKYIVLDGTPQNWGFNKRHEPLTLCRIPQSVRDKFLYLKKADSSVKAVAAASILAKYSRDFWAENAMHKAFPQYGFDIHKGYGTELHMARIAEFGPCDLHRMSFKPFKGAV